MRRRASAPSWGWPLASIGTTLAAAVVVVWLLFDPRSWAEQRIRAYFGRSVAIAEVELSFFSSTVLRNLSIELTGVSPGRLTVRELSWPGLIPDSDLTVAGLRAELGPSYGNLVFTVEQARLGITPRSLEIGSLDLLLAATENTTLSAPQTERFAALAPCRISGSVSMPLVPQPAVPELFLNGLSIRAPALGESKVTTGTLRFRGTCVDIAGFEATGPIGVTRAAGRIELAHRSLRFVPLQIELPIELAQLTPRLSGAARLEATLDGPVGAPVVQASVRAERVGLAIAGRVLSLTELEGQVEHRAGRTRVHALSARVHGGRVEGELTWPTAIEPGPLELRIAGVRLAELVPVSPIRGGTASGSVKGVLRTDVTVDGSGSATVEELIVQLPRLPLQDQIDRAAELSRTGLQAASQLLGTADAARSAQSVQAYVDYYRELAAALSGVHALGDARLDVQVQDQALTLNPIEGPSIAGALKIDLAGRTMSGRIDRLTLDRATITGLALEGPIGSCRFHVDPAGVTLDGHTAPALDVRPAAGQIERAARAGKVLLPWLKGFVRSGVRSLESAAPPR